MRFLFQMVIVTIVVLQPGYVVVRGDDTKKASVKVQSIEGTLYSIPTGKGDKDKIHFPNVIFTVEGAKQDRPTDRTGGFVIEFAVARNPGEDVVLRIKNNGYVIIHPDLKGRLRIPSDNSPIEVWAVKRGDTFKLTNQALQGWTQDQIDAFIKFPKLAGLNTPPDLPGALKKLAEEYKLSDKDVLESYNKVISEWEVSKDNRLKGYAAFAKGDYPKAQTHFDADEALHLQNVDDINKLKQALILKEAESLTNAAVSGSLSGDSAFALQNYAMARKKYTNALKHAGEHRAPELWHSIRFKLAVSQTKFAEAGDPREAMTALGAALQYFRERAESLARQPATEQTARVQFNLGSACRELGKRTAGGEGKDLLRDAIEAHLNALKIYTTKHFPTERGVVQNNLGNTYFSIAERVRGDDGKRFLLDAVAAYLDAQTINTQERDPLKWAGGHTNLGNAYWALADRESDVQLKTKLLKESIESHGKALEEFCKKQRWDDLAGTQTNLGNALRSMGELVGGKDGKKSLLEAVESHKKAVDYYTVYRLLQNQAHAQNNLGVTHLSLVAFVDKADRVKHVDAAITLHLDARTIFKIEHLRLQWAVTQTSLGNAYFRKADFVSDEMAKPLLEAAVAAHKETLGVFVDHPYHLPNTQNGLGHALAALGRRTEGNDGVAILEEAVTAFNAARVACTPQDFPQLWAMIQTGLRDAYDVLRKRASADKEIQFLLAALTVYEESTAVYTEPDDPSVWLKNKQTQSVICNRLDELSRDDAGVSCLFEAIDLFASKPNGARQNDGQKIKGLVLRELGRRRSGPGGVKLLNEAAKSLANERPNPLFDAARAWADIQANLGSVYFALGTRTNGAERTGHLLSAVGTYEEVISEGRVDGKSIRFAVVCEELSAAHFLLSQQTNGDERRNHLHSAIAASRAALKIISPDRDPNAFATAHSQLAKVSRAMGESLDGEEGKVYLRDAVASHLSALKVYNPTPTGNPDQWAANQTNLGIAYLRLGERGVGGEGTAYLHKAVEALVAAAPVFVRRRFDLDYGIVQFYLAITYALLGERDKGMGGKELLLKSVEANENALKVCTKQQFLELWASTKTNLANTFLRLAKRTDGAERKQYLLSSITAYKEVKKSINEAQLPALWKQVDQNLAAAEMLIGKSDE